VLDIITQLKRTTAHRSGHQGPRDSADGSRSSPTRLINTLQAESEQPSPLISAEPPLELSSLVPDEPPTVPRPGG
jgi:hypothetical protein